MTHSGVALQQRSGNEAVAPCQRVIERLLARLVGKGDVGTGLAAQHSITPLDPVDRGSGDAGEGEPAVHSAPGTAR